MPCNIICGAWTVWQSFQVCPMGYQQQNAWGQGCLCVRKDQKSMHVSKTKAALVSQVHVCNFLRPTMDCCFKTRCESQLFLKSKQPVGKASPLKFNVGEKITLSMDPKRIGIIDRRCFSSHVVSPYLASSSSGYGFWCLASPRIAIFETVPKVPRQ